MKVRVTAPTAANRARRPLGEWERSGGRSPPRVVVEFVDWPLPVVLGRIVGLVRSVRGTSFPRRLGGLEPLVGETGNDRAQRLRLAWGVDHLAADLLAAREFLDSVSPRAVRWAYGTGGQW